MGIRQEHVVVLGAGGALHPSFGERPSSMGGRFCWVTVRPGLLVWLLVESVELLGRGRLGDRTSRWTSTLLFMIINSLVYILANIVLSTVCLKKVPSIEITLLLLSTGFHAPSN